MHYAHTCSPPLPTALCSLAIAISPPFALSLPSVWHTALQMFGSFTSFPSHSKFHKGEAYAAMLPVTHIFSSLLLQEASGFVLWSITRILPEVLLIQDPFTQVKVGQQVERVEISNKVESAIGKAEMLLYLIRIWWSVGLGWTSAQRHWHRLIAEWNGSGLNAPSD